MQNATFISSPGHMTNTERLRRRAKVRRKKLSPDDIDRMIKEVESFRRRGISLGIACCHAGVSEETYRKWINSRSQHARQQVLARESAQKNEEEAS